jgi:hypothetical protein
MPIALDTIGSGLTWFTTWQLAGRRPGRDV